MVAYNHLNELIDEFGYIPECAHGVRAVRSAEESKYADSACFDVLRLAHMPDSPQLLESSQTTSLSSQTPERHLAIVFFDILLLNGRSLVFDTYAKRRAALEQLIRPVDGHVGAVCVHLVP